ncbi:hypothetical protein P152DRAFT_247483 [Eremomyces bilateralis CBS 781.70]|uniref:Arrestin C-terminal-like domain-containing protein n=1 Tax=Eremomyces bilateralis CBS 781.70 TaxID=1392243 RepID=A0A6G1GB47_9PEZI|nr:uncharacterized protein P152DRAFT_247483 [Eremomyces bilateralis CBS 781.70]KAF1815156.1 hypothetical protein P152DRAFT_247483 [Eremomyces bilateralis CBS 781.70]
MPASSSGRSPSPKPSPASKASILSLLKSPFSSKIRPLVEFYVQPDDPHRSYSSGDAVTGSVVLKVIRPIRITHIVVCLHGYAQVYKNPNSPGDIYKSYGQSLSQGRTNKSGGYFGNGFVSLFEQEKVLCGDGRLDEGIYRFNFELRFPIGALPSSIEFERGTISYMITSILTRPTTISPIQTCDHRINFNETMDVAPLYQPKPRVISLEPIPRKGKARSVPKNKNVADSKKRGGSEDNIPPESLLGDAVHSTTSEVTSIRESEVPQSPSPSATSFGTCEGSCATSSGNGSGDGSDKIDGSKAGSKAVKHVRHRSRNLEKKPITATIELQKSGYLRGDNITLNLSIKHTKVVKSLNGIIVTLYRQARVDMNPNLPLVQEAKRGSKTDEYYPKSRTGLGGLSLSSAGSSHLFRKDVSQSFAPLIISPDTLHHDIKVTVRVPEGAFPSISNVPGSMISFKYFVEVVLDLHGKLTGLERVLPNAGMMSLPYSVTAGSGMQTGEGVHSSTLAAWPGHFIDTSQIRRNKNVVSCNFEVVIGTVDTERFYGKSKTDSVQSTEATATEVAGHPQSSRPGEEAARPTEAGTHSYDFGFDYASEGHDDSQGTIHPNNGHFPPPSQLHGSPNPGTPTPYSRLSPFPHPSESSPLPPTPSPLYSIPNLPDEQNLSEKDRIRLAEARLLPSAPPADETDPESSSHATRHAPSAPSLEALHHNPAQIPHPFAFPPQAAGLSALPTDAVPSYESHMRPGASEPHTDDKYELQRRQMEMETSAPPTAPEEDENSARPPGDEERVETSGQPSAPTLEQIEGSEGLPRYER